MLKATATMTVPILNSEIISADDNNLGEKLALPRKAKNMLPVRVMLQSTYSPHIQR